MALGFATLLTGACADAPRSCDLDTDSLVLHVTISDTDEGVEAEIELSTSTDAEGVGTALELCSDADRLFVNDVEAMEVRALEHRYYTVEFASAAPSYVLTLDRRDRDDVTILVEAPPSFVIDHPVEQSTHARDAPLPVSWSPAWPDHEIELTVVDEIGSTCIDGLGPQLRVVDSGSHELVPGSLQSAAGSECEVTVSLTRIAEADYPANLAEGGSVTAIVKRRLSFISTD